MMSHVLGFLSPIWRTQMEFLAPGLGQAQPQLLQALKEMQQQVGYGFFCLSDKEKYTLKF